MLTFDDLRFDDDVLNLHIECHLTDPEGEDANLYIKGIYLDYYKNRLPDDAASDKKYTVYEYETGGSYLDDIVRVVNYDVLSVEENGVSEFKNGLFYVIVVIGSTQDDDYADAHIGVVLDWNAVYQKGMAAVAGIAKSCEADRCAPPAMYEQFVIVWHALLLAIEAKDFDMVDRLWGRFLNVTPGAPVTGSSCNCG